jgi:CubicO group peptidase (beta-lactamase class C family)
MTPDHVLAATLKTRLGPGHSRFAAATVTLDETTVAVHGVSPEADFEIGSISKGLTGMLYADACTRGEIGPETSLGELLPLAGCAAGGLKLSAVSRHSSGLPSLAPGLAGSPTNFKRVVSFYLHGTNPYGESLRELLEQARAVRLGPPRPRYSNVGFELLGHAIASGAGLSYRELVATRLCAPLGLDSVYLPATAGELRPEALTGRSRSGRAQDPWTGEALAPAGGARASIGDMARLTRALLDGSAPGVSALDPLTAMLGSAGS